MIVSGGAWGVDAQAKLHAPARWYKEFEVLDKEWTLLGKKAGQIRNEVLVFYLHLAEGCAIIFLQDDAESPGSRGVIKLCNKYDVPYVTVHSDGTVETFLTEA